MRVSMSATGDTSVLSVSDRKTLRCVRLVLRSNADSMQ